MCGAVGPPHTLGSELFQAQSILKCRHSLNTKQLLLMTKETDRNAFFCPCCLFLIEKGIIRYILVSIFIQRNPSPDSRCYT